MSHSQVDTSKPSNQLLRAQSLSVRFESQPVLDEIDFSVSSGEFVSIVGPSGCGKTTILRLVAGLIAPSAGSLSIHGEPRSAFVFQEPNLLPWRNVIGNIRLPLELLRTPLGKQEEAVDRSLKLIQLADSDYLKRPAMLSGGMRMRVSLARALVTQPDILLLDEPFAALDDVLRQRLNEELLNIWLKQRWTALFVTHNVGEAVFLSQRVLVMGAKPGRILETVEIRFPHPRPPELRADPEFSRIALHIAERLRGVAE